MFKHDLKVWLDLSLSDQVKNFKRAKLAEAFGLSPWFLVGCEYGACAPGTHLKPLMIAWMEKHPDLSPNNPECETTEFADMGDLG